MTDTPVDYQLVKQLQGQVADELTRTKQQRDARGERELSDADDPQMALSVINRVVQQHLASVLAAGGELPADSGLDLKLIMAIDSAISQAGEVQELLDDVDVGNIDINGSDEVFITYADHRGKIRGRPIAATDDDLIQIVQNLASYASMNARPFTRANPELDLRLPDGSRDRVAELSGTVGNPGLDRPNLGVVVTGGVRDRRSSIEQVRQVLASIGSPAPVVGFVARDPAGAPGSWAGELTRRFAGSELVRTVRSTAESVLTRWPQPIPDTARAVEEVATGDKPADVVQTVAAVVPEMEGARS
jgi:hypothetical protein